MSTYFDAHVGGSESRSYPTTFNRRDFIGINNAD